MNNPIQASVSRGERVGGRGGGRKGGTFSPVARTEIEAQPKKVIMKKSGVGWRLPRTQLATAGDERIVDTVRRARSH